MKPLYPTTRSAWLDGVLRYYPEAKFEARFHSVALVEEEAYIPNPQNPSARLVVGLCSVASGDEPEPVRTDAVVWLDVPGRTY